MDASSSRLKRRGTISRKVWSTCLWNWRRTFWKGTICAGRHINTLEQRMPPSRWRLFQGRSSIFKKHNAKQHTASIKTAWLHSRRVWVLSWPACSPSLSPTENLESHEGNKNNTTKITQDWADGICIIHEWDKIPLSFTHLQTDYKRRGDTSNLRSEL